MKKLLISILLITLCLIAFKAVILSLMPSDENYVVEKKWRRHSMRSYDIVFVGSSRIQGGIVPTVIDSLLEDGKSINISTGGFTQPYTFDFVKQKMFNDELSNCTLVLEYGGPYISKKRPLEFYRHVLFEFEHSNLSNKINYLSKNIAFKILASLSVEIVLRPLSQRTPINKKLRKGKGKHIDTETFDKSNNEIMHGLTNNEVVESSISAEYISELVSLADTHNVELFFLLTPICSSEEFHLIINDYYAIPERNRLMIQLKPYQSILEDIRLRKDMDHLNHQGAQLYSVLVANALMDRMR